MGTTPGNGGDQRPAVSVFPLPPGPKRDISLVRQHYLEAYLSLKRIDPDWREWLDGIERKAWERSLAEAEN